MKKINIFIIILTLSIQVLASNKENRDPLMLDQYEPVLDDSQSLKNPYHIKRLFIAREQILVNSAIAQQRFDAQLNARRAQKKVQIKNNLAKIKQEVPQDEDIPKTKLSESQRAITQTQNQIPTSSTFQQYSRKKYSPTTQLPSIQEVTKIRK